MRKAVAAVLVLLLAGSGASGAGRKPVAGLRMQALTYEGWEGCVALTAGPYRVVVAPAIGGRIVDYSRDGEGPIWTNPDERGKVHPLDLKVWWNYGGYKTWPAPQSVWGWPPDPDLDAGPAEVTPWMQDGRLVGLRIVGRESPKAGIAFEKRLRLDLKTGRLHLWQTMRALPSDTAPVHWGVWDITQVDADGIIAIPLNAKSRHPGGVYFFSPEAQRSRQWSARNGLLLVHNRGEVTKYGADTDDGWMAWLRGRQAYIKRFPRMRPGTTYPDEYSSAQVYTNNPPLSYIEMEVTAPLVSLKPGEVATMEEEWEIVQLPEPVATDEQAAAAISRLKRSGRLRPLPGGLVPSPGHA